VTKSWVGKMHPCFGGSTQVHTACGEFGIGVSSFPGLTPQGRSPVDVVR
jgi:hypothetical protein